MKFLSLKLEDDVFLETERITKKMNYPRNRYINDALRFYNKHMNRALLKEQLIKESALTRAESMRVNKSLANLVREIHEKI